MARQRLMQDLLSGTTKPRSSTELAFVNFFILHPLAFKAYEATAQYLVETGVKAASPLAVLHKLRSIPVEGKPIKVSNSLSPLFSRWFNERHPKTPIFKTKQASCDF